VNPAFAKISRAEGLPPAILEMQRSAEAAFLRARAQEQEAMLLRAAPPLLCQTPAPGGPVTGPVMRALRRFIPALRRRHEVAVLAGSGLLDAGWYLRKYKDVAAAGMEPALHYWQSGAAEGRDPGPLFSTSHYLAMYPDIAAAGLNPVLHYLRAGAAEGRSIRPDMPHRPPSPTPPLLTPPSAGLLP
jgi:hypothetical protein